MTKILVIEDDSRQSVLMSDVLTLYSYQVLVRLNSLSLLKDLAEFAPHLILLDLRLNNDSEAGIRVLAQLKASQWRHIPVIIHSALYQESFVQKANELGAASFLCKPVMLEELQMAIMTALDSFECRGHEDRPRNAQTFETLHHSSPQALQQLCN